MPDASVRTLAYTNRRSPRPRWHRIVIWRFWRARRALSSFLFGAYPGER